ncbi:MAG: hypothetical protein EXS18_08070 [Verrucomicrobiae bacterium]|nr:hypothetical protein [Verrucomicrobiae bacterium]
MKWLWLLVVLPGVCLARVVQIDELVKKDKAYSDGTVLHETTGHIMEPDRVLASSQYRQEAIFRYCFTGMVKEGAKQYLSITVHNLLLENMVAANRAARSNSKDSTLSRNSIAQSREIVLLVPLKNGRAIFPFPVRVVTASTEERVEVMEAVVEFRGHKLTVVEVAQRICPAATLPWTPPREWPNRTQTIYLEAKRDQSKSGDP